MFYITRFPVFSQYPRNLEMMFEEGFETTAIPDETSKQLSVVVFCYLCRDGFVLLNRRSKEPHYNVVTVPGGKKEPGESVFQACRREMLEETNAELDDIRLSGIISFTSLHSGKEFLGFYFTSNSYSGQIKGSDEGEVFWCQIPESFMLKDISPFYCLISPFVYNGKGRIFSGLIEVDERGTIVSHDLAFEKRGR